MNDDALETTVQDLAQERELSEILQIRRDKLSKLREEGRDPFLTTKFSRTIFSSGIPMMSFQMSYASSSSSYTLAQSLSTGISSVFVMNSQPHSKDSFLK